MNSSTRQIINDYVLPAVECALIEFEDAEQFADSVIALADMNWNGDLPEGVSRSDLIDYWTTNQSESVTTQEAEAVCIIKLYERASIMSNTSPIQAEIVLNIARNEEDEYWLNYYEENDNDDALMPHGFYTTVIPIIRSRGAAARAGRDRLAKNEPVSNPVEQVIIYIDRISGSTFVEFDRKHKAGKPHKVSRCSLIRLDRITLPSSGLLVFEKIVNGSGMFIYFQTL